MELTPEKIEILHSAGVVLKTDTLKSIRESIGLTEKAMAGEMGLKPYHYSMLESGQWKVKFLHLKSAMNVARAIKSF